jgi:hypothetical protein
MCLQSLRVWMTARRHWQQAGLAGQWLSQTKMTAAAAAAAAALVGSWSRQPLLQLLLLLLPQQ